MVNAANEQNKETGKIAITGATGHLGRLVIDEVLRRGVPARRVVAFARDLGKSADLVEKGVEVRNADYTKPESLTTALEGVEKLLLISSNEVGQRFAQHKNVIEAAKKAGVGFIAYTSLLNADASKMLLSDEHKATEGLISESGIPYAILRNGWYIENYTENLRPALEHGTVLGSAGEGKVSAATRADYAAAAAVVLTTGGHENEVYELGGDEAFTLAELAAAVSSAAGRPISYTELPEADFARALASAGLPEAYANVLADSDRGIERGELFTESDDLRRLIGRPTTTLETAIGQFTRSATAAK
jgi:NAD(P)H dehydrogenase (quinone)